MLMLRTLLTFFLSHSNTFWEVYIYDSTGPWQLNISKNKKCQRERGRESGGCMDRENKTERKTDRVFSLSILFCNHVISSLWVLVMCWNLWRAAVKRRIRDAPHCLMTNRCTLPYWYVKSSKLSNFRKRSQIFIIATDFPQILGLDASCDVIAVCIQSKKGCFSDPKMEWTALRSLHAQFTRATLDKLTESRTNPRLGSDRISRSRDTVIHSAGRYSEEISRIHRGINNISVKSCEKRSNSVKATDIRTNATDVETRRNIVQ